MSLDPCILVCGHDPTLLRVRGLVLESAGFRVRTATQIPDATQIVMDGDFDLVVLCHTLKTEECLAIKSTIHSSRPETRIVALQAGNSSCGEASPDSVVRVFNGPAKLLTTVQQLLSEQFAN